MSPEPPARPDEVLPDERRREVRRQALSVGAATGAYGISFGALSVASGLDVWQTQALSLLLFSGGSQFTDPTGAHIGLWQPKPKS